MSKAPKKALVRLNVGGVKFMTTNSTLKQSKYFTDLLLTNRDIQYDQDHNIFIDRNGKIFHEILSYLRDHRICMKEKDDLLWLKTEATYYQIHGLVTDVDEKLAELDAHKNAKYMLLSIEELTTKDPIHSLSSPLSDKYEFIMPLNVMISPGINGQKLLVKVKE